VSAYELCLVERIAVAGSCGIFLERSCGWSLGILNFFESFWRGVFDEAGRIDSVAEELSVFFFLFSFFSFPFWVQFMCERDACTQVSFEIVSLKLFLMKLRENFFPRLFY